MIHEIHRIPGTVVIGAQGVVFLRQRVGAGEDPGGGLEAGEAVGPVYSKELLQFLAGVKIVRFVMNCNWIGSVVLSAAVRYLAGRLLLRACICGKYSHR